MLLLLFCTVVIIVYLLSLLFKLRTENKKLESLVCEDSLTGLLNYRGFVDTLNKFSFILPQSNLELGIKSPRKGQLSSLTLFLLDLDDFKHLNTILGYELANKVLQEVSVALKECFRQRDLIFRFGGDEFAVIIPGIPHEVARELALKAIKKIGNINLSHGLELSASIGVAQARDQKAAEDMFKLANEALQSSKDSGKNQAVFYKDTTLIHC